MVPGVAGAEPAVPNGNPFTLDFGAGELCTFPVEVTGISSQQAVRDDGQGDIFVTGPAVATVVNEDNLKMQTFNISGPGLYVAATFVPVVVTGQNLIFQPLSAGFGSTFLVYTTGRVTFNPDASMATRTGNVTDVCAELS
jgi:hypothetical protein